VRLGALGAERAVAALKKATGRPSCHLLSIRRWTAFACSKQWYKRENVAFVETREIEELPSTLAYKG